VTVSWLRPQNHACYGLSVAPQNRWENEDSTGHASRSNGLLRLEASRPSVSESGLKTGGGAAHMVYMTSSQRSRGDEAEDGGVDVTGCIGLFYPNFVVSTVLDTRCILVF
jgi:hypothetical protein